MLSSQEEQQLKMLLEMLRRDPYYQLMLYHQRMDLSHRLRDEMGRFLPNNYDSENEYRFGKKGNYN